MPSSPSAALLEGELDAIIEDVALTIPSSTNLFYEETSTNNEFDLLFSQPVEQSIIKDDSSIENSMSQMSFLECPVCDEQFNAPTVLENHVFEHSTWIDEDQNQNSKSTLAYDDSPSNYIDLLDETPITPLECKQCTVKFSSNASLNMHKKMSMCSLIVFLINFIEE
jgi:hypothetical protein